MRTLRVMMFLAITFVSACGGAGESTPTSTESPKRVPVALYVQSGNGQVSHFANSSLRQPVVVRVEDKDRRGVPGVAIAASADRGWSYTGPGATDSLGEARFSWSSGVTAGLSTLRLSTTGGLTVTVSATLAASKLAVILSQRLLWRNDTLDVSLTATDSAGTSLDIADQFLIGTVPRFLRALSPNRLRFAADSEGTGVFTASLGSVSARDTVVVASTVSGRLSLLNTARAQDARVFVIDSARIDSTDVDPSGSFALRLRRPLGASGFTLIVDAVDAAASRVLPLLWQEPHYSAGKTYLGALLPRDWRVELGVYAGQLARLSMYRGARVFGQQVAPGYFYTSSNTADGTFATYAYGWLAQDFPLPLSFDRVHSNQPVSGADSNAFFAIIDGLNKTFGRTLFVPSEYRFVRYEACGPGTLNPRDTLKVSGVTVSRLTSVPSGDGFVAGLGGFGTGCRPFVFPPPTSHTRAVSGGIDLLSTVFLQPRIVQHELLHVLSLGHTCFFPSTQYLVDPDTAIASKCARLSKLEQSASVTQDPSKYDVASFEVYLVISAEHASKRFFMSVGEAALAERWLLEREVDDRPPSVGVYLASRYKVPGISTAYAAARQPTAARRATQHVNRSRPTR